MSNVQSSSSSNSKSQFEIFSFQVELGLLSYSVVVIDIHFDKFLIGHLVFVIF